MQRLSHPGCTAFVARVGQPPQTAGFIVGQLAADEAEILTLGVSKEWQRRGIGRRLVEALGRAAEQGGGAPAVSGGRRRQCGCAALYKRLGFEECGRRKGYYVRARRAGRGRH